MEQSQHKVLNRLQRVMRALLPHEEDFFELFSLAAVKAVAAAKCFHDLMNNYQRLEVAREDIHEIEHSADQIVHDTVRRLNSTFVTPVHFDRGDIHRLAEYIDDIIDKIQDTIDGFCYFEIAKPTEHAREMSERLLNATKLLQENISELPRIQPSDHRYCREINTLEKEGDTAHKKALGELFAQEPDVREIIKWKEIYEFIDEAMDRCEDAANLIEAVVTKNA